MALNLVTRFWEIKNRESLRHALEKARTFLLRKSTTSSRNVWRRARLWKLRVLSGGWCIVRDINGSKMELDILRSGPNGIESALALDGLREADATRVFTDVLRNLKDQTTGTIHVFDVGAHIGYYALLEAYLLEERGRVYAIEAEPNNAKRLKKNVDLNEYSNIEVIQAAAGSERTQKELSVRARSSWHRMSEILGDRERVDAVDVDVYPLDRLIKGKNISDEELVIVRMDVEGYETHVFKGMSEFFTSDRPVYLFIEIHPSREAVDVRGMLETLDHNGFKPEYATVDGTLQPIDTFETIRGIDSTTHLMASRSVRP